MTHNLLTTIDQQFSHIVDTLLLNSTLMECPGLINGKMGIAIFFFHYAKYTGNILYADYAIDLIGEIQNQVHINSPADYEEGIAGIGVGIEYLINNSFLIDEADICEDLDLRMVRAVMFDTWLGFSLYNGLVGCGRYWITRLYRNSSSVHARECLFQIVDLIEKNLPDILEEEQIDVYCFLYDLKEISGFDNCFKLLNQCGKWNLSTVDTNKCFSRLKDSPFRSIVKMYHRNRYFNEGLNGGGDINKLILNFNAEKSPTSLGILTGYAGEGLLRLTAFQQSYNPWIFLL